MGNHFCSTIAVVTVVSVPPEVTVMGAEAAETPIATVLGVLAAELGVMVMLWKGTSTKQSTSEITSKTGDMYRGWEDCSLLPTSPGFRV